MEQLTFKPFPAGDFDQDTSDSVFRQEVLNDFYLCCVSREASVIARKEVLTGKAKFGITGDGKELAQVALAKAFRKGDFRAGYYRDQTLLFALGEATVEDYFSQLYADVDHDPFSAGRQMMSHFASPLIKEQGEWSNHLGQYNSSADVSCTAGQMGRAVGLALASKKYRECSDLASDGFSERGGEVVFCTIGDGSTSEGVFWESVNASAVMKIPIAFCVWDDGYAISVPTRYQTVKRSISKAMEGFLIDESGEGIRIYTAKAWDYPSLCDMFAQAIPKIRRSHIPALFHVHEVTQPLGHSTSGSHERYKSEERLAWEEEYDCIEQFKKWIIASGLAEDGQLEEIRNQAISYARECKRKSWNRYYEPISKLREDLKSELQLYIPKYPALKRYLNQLNKLVNPVKSEMLAIARQAFYELLPEEGEEIGFFRKWVSDHKRELDEKYGSHLYTEGKGSALYVPVVKPEYGDKEERINGYQILNRFFDKAFAKHPNLFAFGEDVGKLGDVNQGMKGLQAKYGEERVFDTGIREWTIVGQAIGMAMRGLRPIGEIQYLDYLIYGMEPLVDDLATLSYRSAGIQKAPAIIRTRGHRLEGIWHAGSPMGMLINSLRGIYILVPRNMVQAAGMYNTMLQSLDPAIIIECLNGYRLKEALPENIGEYTVPLGVPEVLHQGSDVTLVTYGSCVRIAQEAIKRLERFDIEVELIDIQTLIPFDTERVILESLKKTNRIIFLDEDVPGGATAFMMQEVIEDQGGFNYLEIAPKTVTASAHRPPYGTEGDYFSKPSSEDVFEAVYILMHELDPEMYPLP